MRVLSFDQSTRLSGWCCFENGQYIVSGVVDMSKSKLETDKRSFEMAKELWKIIESLKGKVTIILTTHYMEEAESLSDRIAIMNKGNVVQIGTAKELIEKTGAKNFEDAFVKIATGGEL